MSELERELSALRDTARFPATPDAVELLGRALERSSRRRRARTDLLARRAALACSVCLAIAASSLLASSDSGWPFGDLPRQQGPGTRAAAVDGVASAGAGEPVRAWKLAALEPELGSLLGNLLTGNSGHEAAGPCRRHGPLSACA